MLRFKIVNLPDHVHFPWQMNVRTPTRRVQIVDQSRLPSINNGELGHFFQLNRNSNRRRTMKSPGLSISQPVYAQCKTVLQFQEKKSISFSSLFKKSGIHSNEAIIYLLLYSFNSIRQPISMIRAGQWYGSFFNILQDFKTI